MSLQLPEKIHSEELILRQADCLETEMYFVATRFGLFIHEIVKKRQQGQLFRKLRFFGGF